MATRTSTSRGTKERRRSGARTTPKKTRRARRGLLALREVVLRSARHLFATNGYADTSIRDIAERAGVAIGGVFRAFPKGKYEIFLIVYDEAWQQINGELERCISPDVMEPEDRLCAIVGAIWQLYDLQPTLVRLATINSGNSSIFLATKDEPPLYTEANRRFVDGIDALCCECSLEGTIPRSVSPAALRELILGTLEGVILGWYLADRPGSGYPPRVKIEEATQLLRAVFAGLQLQRAAEVKSS